MARPLIFSDVIPLRLRPDTVPRLSAVLRDGENVSLVIRALLEQEIARREQQAKPKLERHDDA